VAADVTALILDFFGVVVDYDETIMHRRLAPFCKDPVAALPALDGLGSDPGVDTGRTALTEVYQGVVERLGLNMSLDAFIRAWSECYSRPMPA
jgi:hypothetical protein